MTTAGMPRDARPPQETEHEAPHRGNLQRVVGAVVESIASQGFAVAPGFLTSRATAALRARVQAFDAAGRLVPARVGRGAGAAERSGIRGDRIRWLDDADGDPAERPLRAALDVLRVACNRELQLGLVEVEAHYAVYPPGSGYARHRDRFRDDDARVLSVVVYLNERWRARDAGALRLHLDGRTLDVAPAGGTLVAMLADRIEHEVLPAARPRMSVAGWFRRRA